MLTFLGIDIGGSGFKFGWGNSRSGLQYFSSLPLVEKNLAAFHKVAQAVLDEAERRLGLEKLSGIGIGTPGTIDAHSGLITGINPNLPFWVGRSPLELIPAETGLNVRYDNDANLMALAEAKTSGLRNVLGITVGSGIGSGLVIDGKIFHGAHGFAGELGHICMVKSGALCNCGLQGCLEAYSSVDGIRNRLEEQSPRFKGMDLSKLLSLRDSDPVVRDHIAEGLRMLCLSVSQVITYLDPEAVIFGGGAMDLGLYSLSELSSGIAANLAPLNREATLIKAAHYGNRAGVMGAIMLFESDF